MGVITAVRLPIDWVSFDLPASLLVSGVVVGSGRRGWAWRGVAPDLGVPPAPLGEGVPVPGLALDHIVVVVPDLDRAVRGMAAADIGPRRRAIVKERPTAFFLVGILLEVVEEPTVDTALLWGLSLETEEPLAAVVERWRAAGHDVSEPRPAYQPGRSIITVRDAGAGLAVMSPR